jgi:hypothetical protein
MDKYHVTVQSSPLKLLNQIKPNLEGMVPGWVPFKIVSDSSTLHSRWLLLLKIEFLQLPRFSGFREEDLNVIFYQNMPNLHNRHISVERKISQKNPDYMLSFSVKFFFQPIYADYAN